MSLKLSEGALSTIMSGDHVEKPVLQILGNRHISSNGAQERYRLLVSDGKHLISFAMLATQLNERLKSGELADHTVIRVDRYITSLVNNANRGMRRVMIILELEVLAAGSDVNMQLGSPVGLPSDAGSEKSNDQGSGASAPKPAPAPQRPAAPPAGNKMVRPSPMKNSIMDSPGDMHTYPIASLNPYQNKWVIRARVFNKSPIRTWSNARGEGKLFSMDLVDESGEIRATAFKEQCDKFYDVIEVNNVYYISRCTLKTANKKFTSIKHDYEMSFTDDTQVIPCHEESSDIPTLSFDFMPLQQVTNQEVNALVDVIGVCKVAHDCQTLIAKTTNKELKKRELLLVDSTNTGITLTLWGNQAETFDTTKHPVIAVKSGRVNEFGGAKSVSLAMASILQIDPDIPEAHRLRGWFDAGGCEHEVKNLSATNSSFPAAAWTTLHEAKMKQLGVGDKAEYFTCKATLMVVKTENSIYKACPTQQCNKKVTDLQNGMYRCEKCAQEFPNFKFRLLVSAAIADWTSKQWVTGFQEVAETLVGMSADELGEMQINDSNGYLTAMGKAAFKSYIFRLRSKCEMYNDETRIRTVLVAANPVNFKEYNRHLIEKIKKVGNMSTGHQ